MCCEPRVVTHIVSTAAHFSPSHHVMEWTCVGENFMTTHSSDMSTHLVIATPQLETPVIHANVLAFPMNKGSNKS